jgi:D-alanine-D-alanine ligase
VAEVRRLVVVTGDHSKTDSTKLGGIWREEDLMVHRKMVEAMDSLDRFETTVIDDHAKLFEELLEIRPDLVVNFCDTGIFNKTNRELNLPAWLELQEIPYTGATPQAIVQCFDKQAVRLVSQVIGVEVPGEAYIAADAPLGALPDFYPALLKPNQADGSVGITKDAVVRDESEAQAYLEFLRDELPGRDVLWQEYLPGPEYGIGLIGNPKAGFYSPPPLVVDFSALPEGANPILSFESKTDPESPYWTDIRYLQADLDKETHTRLVKSCEAMFQRFGLQDYGRFDFRVATDGRPKMMEVNCNPAWGFDAKLAIMSGFAGLTYARMLEMIIDAAIARIS